MAASVAAEDATSERARQWLVDATSLAIPLVVLCEYFWVMRSRFKRPRNEILGAIDLLVQSGKVSVDEGAVAAGLAFARAGGDFADGVIAHDGRRLGGNVFASFDARARQIAADNGLALA